MGYPGMHGHGWGHEGMHASGHGGVSPFMIPVPVAVFGACMAFMMGAMMARRMGMMCGPQPWGPRGMMGMGMPGMMGHHHHGYGKPACCASHTPMEEASEGAEVK